MWGDEMASGEVLGFVLGIWGELAAGTPDSDAPVGVITLTSITEPPDT